jgi:tetratricopeptide (TPR) repeat protein
VNARRAPMLAVLTALFGFYAWRWVSGIKATDDLEWGLIHTANHDFLLAVPYLDRAAVGAQRLRAVRLAGEARVYGWEHQVRHRGALAPERTLLEAAARDFLECRCAGPASRRSWEGLGEVYDDLEWIGRERRSERPLAQSAEPWDRVGKPGRIAVGLLRSARDLAPGWFRIHDKLALTLWAYGLEKEARQAVRDSARALPLFAAHSYRELAQMPAWVMDEFASASWEVLGQTPQITRTAQLIDLGKLERRAGHDQRAVEALREAVAHPGDVLNRAEANYHLGLALIAVGQVDEGIERLTLSGEHPVFHAAALRSLAVSLEGLGRYAEALEYLRKLRWSDPDDLWACLQFAIVARHTGDGPGAIEALEWAKDRHPEDRAPSVALVQTYLALGQAGAAKAELEQLTQRPDAAADVERLRRALAEAGR